MLDEGGLLAVDGVGGRSGCAWSAWRMEIVFDLTVATLIEKQHGQTTGP